MQNLIKLKLIGLGYNKKSYNMNGFMNWLNQKNDIIFITIPELVNSDIFTQFNYKFLIPAITNYEDYLKIKEKYGGLPLSLEKYDTKYIRWLDSIDFYNFVKQQDITILFRDCWYIHPHNYKVIKKINSETEKKSIKKSIKIKKIKI